jgi:FMN reductase
MSEPMLAVITAGLSQPSSTRLLADRLAAATTAARPAQVVTIELRDLAHDIVTALLTGFPGPALAQAIAQVTGADAVIAVTPLFNGSYSGLFKSFFDVLDPGALTGKPVLLGAAGGTARHSLALEHAIRPLFSFLRAVTMPTAVFAATADWGAGEAGRELTARIARAGAELAAAIAPAPVPTIAPAPVPTTVSGPSPLVQKENDLYEAAVATPFAELLHGR